jgi:Cupredoxin-like domain
MTQHNETPQVPSDSGTALPTQAQSFLRRHRFGMVGAGLLGVLAVAGIANADPNGGHSTCCTGHHHESSASAAAATPDANGKVLVTADGRGFHPPSVEITKGQKTTLEFRRTSNETCATSVVFPELKLERALPLNQPVAIELPADVSSPLTFQCGMGMYHGKVVVH